MNLKKVFEITFYLILFVVLAYVWLAWLTFQYANPKSNEMSFYRHFWKVMSFQVMEEYQ